MPARLQHQWGLVGGVASAFLFRAASQCLARWPSFYPGRVRREGSEYRCWRYRNFSISLLHALLTGLCSLCIVLTQPSLFTDAIHSYNRYAYALVSASFGYFLYDTVEMLTHLQYKGTGELIVHHVLVILCFSNTLVCGKYVGYNMVALLIELSNISLHVRQLLLLSGWQKGSLLYRLTSTVNLVLYLAVRGSCMWWLWVTLLAHAHHVPLPTKWIGLVAMTGISITTLVLLKRIVVADFASRETGPEPSRHCKEAD